MIILYAIATLSACGLTFYFTRRNYYRPSAPLPTQTNKDSIAIPSEATTAGETPQDAINNLVTALDQNSKIKHKPQKYSSWMHMNEGKR